MSSSASDASTASEVEGAAQQQKKAHPKSSASSNENTKRKSWTEEEEGAFVGALRVHGTDFKKFLDLIPTRNLQQIQSHYAARKHRYESLDTITGAETHTRQRRSWSVKEEEAFVTALKTHGTDWKKFVPSIPDRTRQQIHGHFKMCKQRYQSIIDGADKEAGVASGKPKATVSKDKEDKKKPAISSPVAAKMTADSDPQKPSPRKRGASADKKAAGVAGVNNNDKGGKPKATINKDKEESKKQASSSAETAKKTAGSDSVPQTPIEKKRERKRLPSISGGPRPTYFSSDPVSITTAYKEYLGLGEYKDKPVPGGFQAYFVGKNIGGNPYPRHRIIRDVARKVRETTGSSEGKKVDQELEKLDRQRQAKGLEFWEFFHAYSGGDGKLPTPKTKRRGSNSSLGNARGEPRPRLEDKEKKAPSAAAAASAKSNQETMSDASDAEEAMEENVAEEGYYAMFVPSIASRTYNHIHTYCSNMFKRWKGDNDE